MRDAHMCLLNQRLLLIEAGSGAEGVDTRGGLDLPGFLSYQGGGEQSQESYLPALRFNVYHLNPPKYHTNE